MTTTTSPDLPRNDRAFFVFNAIVSAAALTFLGWLLLVHHGEPGAGVDLRFLPAVNASFNALSAALLVVGYVAIKSKRVSLHRTSMVGAFVSSSLFLVCYIAYHAIHGDTKYAGDGAMRTIYLVILASHILLSVAIVPLALSAFYFAFRRVFSSHKKVTRVLLPIWLYVSVTGVVIFFMLRGSLPAVP